MMADGSVDRVGIDQLEWFSEMKQGKPLKDDSIMEKSN
jgi:hypothetical protein